MQWGCDVGASARLAGLRVCPQVRHHTAAGAWRPAAHVVCASARCTPLLVATAIPLKPQHGAHTPAHLQAHGPACTLPCTPCMHAHSHACTCTAPPPPPPHLQVVAPADGSAAELPFTDMGVATNSSSPTSGLDVNGVSTSDAKAQVRRASASWGAGGFSSFKPWLLIVLLGYASTPQSYAISSTVLAT